MGISENQTEKIFEEYQLRKNPHCGAVATRTPKVPICIWTEYPYQNHRHQHHLFRTGTLKDKLRGGDSTVAGQTAATLRRISASKNGIVLCLIFTLMALDVWFKNFQEYLLPVV